MLLGMGVSVLAALRSLETQDGRCQGEAQGEEELSCRWTSWGPRALGRQLKEQDQGSALFGLRDSPPPHRPPSPHTPFPPLPSILPSHSCHLWASVPPHPITWPPASTHSTCPLRKFWFQIPTSHHRTLQPPLTVHVFSESSSSNPAHGSSVSSSGHLLSHGLLANLWSGHVEARLWP